MKFNLGKIRDRIPKALKTKKTAAAIVLILIGFIILTRGSANTKQIKLSNAQIKTLTTSVSASGIVKSESETTLKFATSGKIAWIGVKEGDKVSKGKAITSLDREKFEIALRQAQQDLLAADATLTQVYDDLKKFPQPENFDQKIKRTNAESAKNKAYDEVKEAEENLRNTTIYAPFAGTITSLDIVVGDEIPITTQIGEIADLETLVFAGEVDETDIGKVARAQKSKIILDAFPNEEIETSVKSIGSRAITTSAGATAYEIKFDLSNDKNYLLGMNGEAEIIISENENVLTIPLEAVVDEKFVWIKENGTYTKIEIKTGTESDTEIEVINNLKENDQVITSGFSELTKKSLLEKILRR